MCFVLQVHAPDVVFEEMSLINELIALGRNANAESECTGTYNRPWLSSGSGDTPQTGQTSPCGGEHDLVTVRSPGRTSQYPGVVKSQALGRAACGGHDIQVRYDARGDRTDESHPRTVG